MPVSTKNTDLLTASLGKPVALAYGKHLVGGNVILKDELDASQTILFVALGEGEWDAIEKLWVNGKEMALEVPENYQFHKGLDGELSSDGGLKPEGVGSLYPFDQDGDQKVDALTPPEIQGLTFSGTAYLALRIPFDVFAPGPDVTVLGIYKTRRVRFFDASGVQTGSGYSDNPAWIIADLLTVVRVKHDAAPWSQAAAGDALFETFEVLEVAENPDETREFLCQLYRASTYPDTAGPTQNLIGTTVRRRPAVPPKPADWELAADIDGFLRLGLTIPANADYRTGDLTVLEEIESLRVKTTLTAPLAAEDGSVEVDSSAGFEVGDYINIGQEVLRIIGPGLEGNEPTSTTWQVARAQKLSEPGAANTDDVDYRLTQREFHFVLPAGFTLARPGKRHTIKFKPGNVRILYAVLVFTGLGGKSDLAEMPFWGFWESERGAALVNSLPGLRVTSGGLATQQVPGPLTTGEDLVADLFWPVGQSLGILSYKVKTPPTGQPIRLGHDVIYSHDSVFVGGIAEIPVGETESGPVASGAATEVDNNGNIRFHLKIIQVGSINPGEDLTAVLTF